MRAYSDGYLEKNPEGGWMRYARDGGRSLDVDLLAKENGGAEGLRELLANGRVSSVAHGRIKAWLKLHDERVANIQMERQILAAEQQALSAKDAVVVSRRSLYVSVFAAVIALLSLGISLFYK